MDVSVNPVLESVRPFFQGLPANNASPATSTPSHPGAATPVQWPQRPKTPPGAPGHGQPAAKSPALPVYNGANTHTLTHNLPPVAAAYQHTRTATARHPPQFRTPDYPHPHTHPQSNHHSIYSPNSASSQSRSSSSYQSQVLAAKYQSSPNSPAVSSPSPHAYSYSPRTSLPMSSATTSSSPAYPQTTSASSVYVSSSHHHRQQLHNAQIQQTSQHPPQQSRPPSNQQHPSHHPMSPVIQQPSQHHQHLQHSTPSSHQQPSLTHSQHLVQQQPSLHHQHQQQHQQLHQQQQSYPQQHPTHSQQQQLHHAYSQQKQGLHQQGHVPQHHGHQSSREPHQRSQQHQQHQLLSQQRHQLQQQAAMYNQTVQAQQQQATERVSRQSDADKLAEMQEVLRIKQRQLAAVQAQQQAYYAAAAASSSSRPSSQTTSTTIEASNHQRTTTTQSQSLPVGPKRESPLDLSVKTVRQSADSTAKDDSESLYLSAHDPFQHRSSKPPIKTASPRSSVVLPPLQLPSTVVYPHFENHSSSQKQNSSSGAPKVDFLPNFNAHHSSSSESSASFQDLNKRQRKSSTSQIPSSSQYPHPTHLSSLPHMGSFKKSSLPSAAYEDPNKQSQYYPNSGSHLQRSTPITNHSSLNMQQNFAVAPNSQYHYDSFKRVSSARYDYLERRNSTSSLQSISSNESTHHLGKRQPSSDLRHPLPPKIPKVDTWRQTIDQQIEQRLNSYASSRGHHVNRTAKDGSLINDHNLPKQTLSPYTSVPNIQTSHTTATLPSSNSLVSRSSLFSSHLPNSSSKLNLANQYYPHSQPQYPTHSSTQRTAPELYNNLAQVKLPNPPSNGAADKRVLSILRKRLDTREASNQLALQQQAQQTALSQDRSKMYTSLVPRPYSQQLAAPSPVVTSQSKPPTQVPVGRHNLPPFNALSLDRSAAAVPYSNQKLHIPKAMDSAGHEYSQNNSFSTRSDVPRSLFPPRTEATNKPAGGENGSDFDGLAAYLAARIRTKAELKQVGPSVEQQRIPTPASGSNSSAHSPRTTPGIFSPPPSTQIHYPALPGDLGKGTPTSESDRASGSSGSPMKSTKDRYGNSPRRRLFSRAEEESGVASEGVIQAREVGLRSSSETSVFDFRESDSDGEMASERQSLNEMRKDRDKRLQEKHQTEPVPSPDPTRDPNEMVDSVQMDDSFWSGMCDQFVDQLEKGGNKVRKRGRRKKCTYTQVEYDPLQTFEHFEEAKSESSFSGLVPDVGNIKLEKEEHIELEKEENIKLEKEENMKLEKEESTKPEKYLRDADVTNSSFKVKMEPDKQNSLILKENIKKEEESSDEDAPLSVRKSELQKASPKVEESTNDEEKSPLSAYDKSLDRFDSSDLKKDYLKDCPKPVIKKELTDSEAESSADESIDSVAKRLRMRKPKEEESGKKRKTRASEKENSGTPQKGKGGRKKKGVKKKSVYGDGSEFRPGWEAEVYRYKRSLRMPARLINIAGPQSWPRLSVSLPDLDPDSPMTLDSEISLQNKRFESDGETTPTKYKPTDSPQTKSSQKKDQEKKEEDSFINRLIQRYGGKGKKSFRKVQEKDSLKEKKAPKIIPQTTELELLPTPSLDCIVKTPNKKSDNATSHRQTKGNKFKKGEENPADFDGQETVYLGYFRKKTVADFRDAFAKHNGGFATEHELPPIMLKSRTRTQTRILTQRATIREVFGDDRPASAPPAGCRSEELEENEKPTSDDKRKKKSCTKSRMLIKKLNSSSGITPGTRPGLRSAAFLRSNKAVLKSKQQLLHGGERRKRSKDLIKAFKSSKKYQKDSEIKSSDEIEEVLECKPLDSSGDLEEDNSVLVSEKRLKYRNVRRKLKSSGFDYIRKKKKQQQKKEGETESVKEKKKVTPIKPILESEEDIQNEIKGWVINKGLGETVLHRAARLGYTDIAAYCLEKMDHNPSPRDNAGYTPLHDACAKGRLDIARLLLMYGADVSDSAQGGIRPLHEAAESGSVELMRLLLSYGADPLLATYTGLTPLSLTHHHPEARTLLQHHLADVQGLHALPWQVQLTEGSSVSGYDPLMDPPSPDPADVEVEVESGELSLPHLYQLLGEPLTDRWVLFQELGPVLRVKTREALIKQLGQSHRNDFRDLKMTDFYDMARCCSIMSIGDYILNPKAHKVTLVKYSERVRALLNSEKLMVTAR